MPDAIGALWGKLRTRFADKPAADEALKDLLANPDDSDLQVVFRVQLKKLLQDDAAFADEIKGLVDSAGKQTSYTAEVHGSGSVAQGPGAVAAGEGGMAIGGDVHGDVNVQHGDRTRQGGVDVKGEQVKVTGDVVGGDKIEHHTHIEQGTAPAEPGAEPSALRNAYLNRILENTAQLSLGGIDRETASESATSLNLGAVYTALLTLTPEEHEHLQRETQPEREIRRLSALAQLNRHARLVLLGVPGSGKSTFVNFVAMCLAGEALRDSDLNLKLLSSPLPDDKGDDQEERQPWKHGALLPVRVILRDFAVRGLPPVGERATAEHLWRFIAAELERAALQDYIPHLHGELLEQGGLILLDGLDEVPEANERRVQLKQAVEDFAKTFGQCRLLVTSRTYAYQKQDWVFLHIPQKGIFQLQTR